MAGLRVSIFGPEIGEKWGFRPSEFLGGTYEHPYKIVRNIPRREAKFRENRPRDVEESVVGNKKDK